MPERDVTEKYLESYNDVFADIVNVLLFNGQRRVLPDDLRDTRPTENSGSRSATSPRCGLREGLSSP